MEEIGILRWFLETARSHSFTITSQRFGVTPAAVSQGIARLERQLGARLFRRTTRRLSLTEEGRLYYEQAADGLRRLDAAAEAVKEMHTEPKGLVRMSISATFGKQLVIPVLSEFLGKNPAVDLELFFTDGTDDLVDGGFDIAIRRGAFRDSYSVTRALCNLSLALVASPGYLARKGVPRAPRDLRNHEWIGTRLPEGSVKTYFLEHDPERRVGDDAMRDTASPDRRYHIEVEPLLATTERVQAPADELTIAQRPRRVSVSEQLDATVPAAVAGLGIAVISLQFALAQLESGQLKVVLPDYRITGDTRLFIQYPQREYLPPKIRVLIDFLVEKFSGRFDARGDATLRRQYAAMRSRGRAGRE